MTKIEVTTPESFAERVVIETKLTRATYTDLYIAQERFLKGQANRDKAHLLILIVVSITLFIGAFLLRVL